MTRPLFLATTIAILTVTGNDISYAQPVASQAGTSVLAETTGNLAEIGKVYTLFDALRQTATTNPEIKRQGAVVEQVRKREDVARSEFLPRLNYNYQRGRARIRSDAQSWDHFSDQTQELRAEQNLFAGGSSIAGYKRAKLLTQASELSHVSLEQAVLAETAAAYIQLHTAREIIRFTEKNLTSLGSQRDITNTRYDLQDVTLTDLAQANARLALAEADHSSALEQLRQAEANFKRLVGIDPPEELAEPKILFPMPKGLAGLKSTIEQGNPRIRQAQLEARAAKKSVHVVRGEFLPQVSLVASNRRSKQDKRLFTGRDRFDDDALMLNVNIPLYEGGATLARYREAQYAAVEAKYAAVDIQREITAEVVRAWEAYKAARAIKQANFIAVDATAQTLEGMREEYKNGQRTLTDVLDAERELFRSRVGLARAEEQRLINAYQLLALLNAIKF